MRHLQPLGTWRVECLFSKFTLLSLTVCLITRQKGVNTPTSLLIMARNLKVLILTAGTVLLLGSNLQAQLFMHVDTVAKTVGFTGSDSGTTSFSPIPDTTKVAWQVGGPAFGFTSMVDIMAGLSVSGDGAPMVSATLGVDSDSPTHGVFVEVVNASPGGVSKSMTITGLATALSYATLSGAQQAEFEGTIGTTLPLLVGSSYAGLQVVATPVPEPHEYALAAALGLLGFVAWRRRS